MQWAIPIFRCETLHFVQDDHAFVTLNLHR